MMKRSSVLAAATLAFVGISASTAAGDATIVLDFTHDTFFQSNSTALAALNAAAGDISAALTSSLGATTDTSSGTFGGSTAIFNFSWSYTNPATGAAGTVDPTVLAANQVRVFVGARNLTAPTLGIGGPGGVSIGGSGTFSNQSEWNQAVAIAAANATANQGRGGGPIVFDDIGGTFSGAPFSIDFGNTIGSFAVDNVGVTWHFDHTTPVAGGAIDLYSVALHEILHAVGFGTADSWQANRSGTNWLGSEAIAHFGTGTNIMDSGGGHAAGGLMSQRIQDGLAQEVAMDPDIAPGQRKYLTWGDLAFMRDAGWQTTMIPEPASLALLGLAGLILLRRRAA